MIERPAALVFGEVLIDEFPDSRVVAGAPLHVATQLAVRDWDVYMVSRIGRDNDGEWIVDTLAEHGVSTDYVTTDDELPTGVVSVELHDDGHSFVIHGPAAWDAMPEVDELPVVDVLYWSGLATRDERSWAAWRSVVELSDAAMIVMDVNLRPPDVYADRIRSGIEVATLVKLSDEEMVTVAELLDIDEDVELFDVGPDLAYICVTHGADGAELVGRDGRGWRAVPEPVEVVDAVGAGDAFTAGLIDALARGVGPEAALEAGHRAALQTLGQRGGLPH